MDPITFYIFNKFQNQKEFIFDFKEICLLIFILTMSINFKDLLINFKFIYEKFCLYFYKYKYIEICGDEVYDSNGVLRYNYPEAYIAISWYISEKKLGSSLKTFNKNKNEILSFWDLNDVDKKNTEYLINAIHRWTSIDKYIEVSLTSSSKEFKNTNTVSQSEMKTIWLRSTKINLQEFLNNIIVNYKKFIYNKSKDKLYHFIYQGQNVETKELLFSTYLLDDLNNITNFESFTNIFHDHVDTIQNDIKRLRNLEYYKKTGLKRKKGYLFYGDSGCGKTSTVMAISKEDSRHILEIPMSRVSTNSELEKLINITTIGLVEFKKEELIILFDEIDIGTSSLGDRVQIEKWRKLMMKKMKMIQKKILKRILKKIRKKISLKIKNLWKY